MTSSSSYANGIHSSSSAPQQPSKSQRKLQESDAVSHLQDLEERYLIAYMRYLLVSVSIFREVFPQLCSPSLSTLSLPLSPSKPTHSNSTSVSSIYRTPPPAPPAYWDTHYGMIDE